MFISYYLQDLMNREKERRSLTIYTELIDSKKCLIALKVTLYKNMVFLSFLRKQF